MTPRFPVHLAIPADLAVELTEAAVQTARTMMAEGAQRKHPRRGQTLKPGLDTPLWNALVPALNAQFKRRGDRARLARVLGLPRQRLTEMLRGQRHLPDAERTLLLLVWLHARRHGQDLA